MAFLREDSGIAAGRGEHVGANSAAGRLLLRALTHGCRAGAVDVDRDAGLLLEIIDDRGDVIGIERCVPRDYATFLLGEFRQLLTPGLQVVHPRKTVVHLLELAVADRAGSAVPGLRRWASTGCERNCNEGDKGSDDAYPTASPRT